MTVEINTDNNQIKNPNTQEQNNEPSTSTTETHRKVKKSSKRRQNDVKHVARKLIMAWKLASEHQSITWKEIAPIIDSVEYISTHWESDERLKAIEPVAVDIVSQVNKIHLELNLRVFGMNRLRIITEEFLNLLRQERQSFIDDTTKSQNISDNVESSESSENKDNKSDKTEQHNTKSIELLDKLINSLKTLFDLLNEPSNTTPLSSAPNSPKANNAYITPPQKHKAKKRNIFSGFFSSNNQKQSSLSNTSSSSTLYNSESSTNSSSSNLKGLETYKNNIVSEWQEYTRKFVEPNYLFKVCKCYLAANPSAIPSKASLIGQNWICIANEISMSLWNILKKREDDLASSLIFLTLYKHGSPDIIERAINTIGSQLPEHLYVRLEYALKIKEFNQLTKEQQNMLDSNYRLPEDINNTRSSSAIVPNSPSSVHQKSPDLSNKKTNTLKKNEKKKKHTSLSEKSESGDEPISFADMLAM